MARKPENAYRERVHRHLPTGVYAEKTHNPFRAGIPDSYYEGCAGCLWIEYKWLNKLPDMLCPSDLRGFTKLQQRWLKRAYGNGQQVGVIVGSPQGGVVFEGTSWEQGKQPQPQSNKEIAEWLRYQVSSNFPPKMSKPSSTPLIGTL